MWSFHLNFKHLAFFPLTIEVPSMHLQGFLYKKWFTSTYLTFMYICVHVHTYMYIHKTQPVYIEASWSSVLSHYLRENSSTDANWHTLLIVCHFSDSNIFEDEWYKLRKWEQTNLLHFLKRKVKLQESFWSNVIYWQMQYAIYVYVMFMYVKSYRRKQLLSIWQTVTMISKFIYTL